MPVVTSPIDDYHAISMILTNWIRSRIAKAHQRVAAWEPRPYRREYEDGTQQ